LSADDSDGPQLSFRPDDLSRDVYCVLGIPVDAIEMADLLGSIRAAAASKTPFLISTPNLNFLVSSQTDAEFRESLLASELCPADGISIVGIARLLGVPIKRRVAGSDLFDALRAQPAAAPLNVFLFGGEEGVAASACRALNAQSTGLRCVGSLFPGFGSVEDMTSDDIIARINASGADFLVVALGAKKGQSWLLRNHSRLRIPVRVHLGAAVNFQAGTVKRAPHSLQSLGLEWLWRIKEEPQLWRRYWNDGMVLLHLLLTRVLPIGILRRRLHGATTPRDLTVSHSEDHESVVLRLSGQASSKNLERAIAAFKRAAVLHKNVTIDFSDTSDIDARFLGLLLMLSKVLKRNGANLTLIGLSPGLSRLFRLHGAQFLLF
jgi:N-acetylglucosaminyldiphosphoundecaprenol N-acetyl-beta-D-mannosaminyltransferase